MARGGGRAHDSELPREPRSGYLPFLLPLYFTLTVISFGTAYIGEDALLRSSLMGFMDGEGHGAYLPAYLPAIMFSWLSSVTQMPEPRRTFVDGL
jgi:hypothetical protein